MSSSFGHFDGSMKAAQSDGRSLLGEEEMKD